METTKNYFIEAVLSLAKDKYISASADGNVKWKSDAIDTPTDAEITAEITRLQAEYDNNQYQRDRNYAPTGDQLDMLWHSIDAGEFGDTAKQSEFYTANKAVKDASPKP